MKRDASLNFDFVPYWTIPYRFFLTAPLFAVAGGIVLVILGAQLLWDGNAVLWQSRWLKEVIFTLHLITLGTITMVMVGALFQITSVVGGRLLPGGRVVPAIVYSSLVLGVLLFLVAMLKSDSWLYAGAATFIVFALLLLSFCGLIAIGKAQRRSSTLLSMRLAMVSLLVTITIGGGLLLMNGYPDVVGFDRRWTDFHLLWALAGWVGLLIMGVSFQVVPMFHVTPSFSQRVQTWMPIATFTNIVITSGVTFFYPSGLLSAITMGLLLACFAVYAVCLWRLLGKRKRKIEDITVLFWKTAIIALALFILIQCLSGLGLFDHWGDKSWLVRGVILIFGVIVSVLGGMLQKIIPFLSYLHMQRFCAGNFEAIKALPHMRAILKIKHSRYFFRLHLISLGLLVMMVVVPELTLFAGLSVCLEFLLLFFITARVAVMVWNAESNSLTVNGLK